MRYAFALQQKKTSMSVEEPDYRLLRRLQIILASGWRLLQAGSNQIFEQLHGTDEFFDRRDQEKVPRIQRQRRKPENNKMKTIGC